MKYDFKEIQNLKETLCFKRLELVRLESAPFWTKIDIDRALTSLKNNKSRDPHNLINEIFKPGVIGDDLKFSLL